jgi:hypothetical protein
MQSWKNQSTDTKCFICNIILNASGNNFLIWSQFLTKGWLTLRSLYLTILWDQNNMGSYLTVYI